MDRPRLGDRPDQVHPDVGLRHLDPRRLPRARVALPGLLVGRCAGLVAPVDLRILADGPLLESRVGLLQPRADLLGVLVLGVTARHLGRVTPPPEVLADGPHWHGGPVLIADPIAAGLTGPDG